MDNEEDEEDEEYENSLKKQEEDFDAMTAFIESQIDPNGHTGNAFKPNIIMYMMDKIWEAAEYNKNASEAQENDDLNTEIQQWDNIKKALSKADKVRKSLEDEMNHGE